MIPGLGGGMSNNPLWRISTGMIFGLPFFGPRKTREAEENETDRIVREFHEGLEKDKEIFGDD